jgi:DNA-binding transcriptional regulator YiaG
MWEKAGRDYSEGNNATAAAIDRLTGIGEATISRWERGRILPNRAMDRYLRLLDRNRANARLLKTFASLPTDTKSGIV